MAPVVSAHLYNVWGHISVAQLILFSAALRGHLLNVKNGQFV